MSAEIIHLTPRRHLALEHRLREIGKTTRLNKGVPRAFAVNLGMLAAKLDPNTPSAGARRMFDKAFGDESERIWPRRKRLVRLPGEKAEDSDRASDYESAGGRFERLLKAFAELSEPSSVSALNRAILALVRGTEHDPNPGAPAEFEGGEYARSILKMVESEVTRDGVAPRAFDFLKKYPISSLSRYGMDDDDFFGNLVDNALMNPEYKSDFCFLGYGKNSIPDDYIIDNRIDIPWYIPRVLIGYGYEKCFRYGVRGSILKRLNVNENLSQFADEIIEKTLLKLSDSQYEEIECYLRYSIYLSIVPTDGGTTKVVLFGYCEEEANEFQKLEYEYNKSLRSTEYMDLYVTSDINGNRIISISDLRTLNAYLYKNIHEIIDLGYCYINYLDDDYTSFIYIKNNEDDEEFNSYELNSISSWLDPCDVNSDGLRHILESGGPREDIFDPVVWDAPDVFAGAPQLSVAATIIRNHLHGPEGERVSDLLLRDIHLRLKPFLAFMDKEMEELRELTGWEGG
jgi:hypothetical protein